MVAVRMAIGALALLALGIFQKPDRTPSRAEWGALVWVTITDVSLPLVLTTWGQLYIDSGVASVLLSTVPIFTIIVAHFYLREERATAWQWTGILAGFVGVYVLLSRDLGANPEGSLFGYAAHLIGSASYAVASIITRSRLAQTPLFYQSFITVVLGDIMIWPLALAIESPITLPVSALGWTALFWQALIATTLATMAYYYLVHSIGPTRTSLVTYMFPVVAVTLGVIFLNEPLDARLLAGAALVLGSVVVVNRT